MKRLRALILAAAVVFGAGYEAGHWMSQPAPPPAPHSQVLSQTSDRSVREMVNRQEFLYLTNHLMEIKQEVSEQGIDHHAIYQITAITHQLSRLPQTLPWSAEMDIQLQETIRQWPMAGSALERIGATDAALRKELKSTAGNLIKAMAHLCHG